MIQMQEQVKSTAFPPDLEHLWGRTVTAQGSIVRRSVIELPPKGGKSAVTVIGPAFWKSKAHRFDKVEFEGRLVKEKGNVVGFKSIKGVKVFAPVQTTLDGFVEVEGIGEEIWGPEKRSAS